MRPIVTLLLCGLMLSAPFTPAVAQVDLPASMPPLAVPAEIGRNLGFAIKAWETIDGIGQASQPGKVVIQDFVPLPLTDGSVVIPGLGVRLRPVKEANRDVLEIVDIQEFGAFWASRGKPPFGIGDIGGLINGDVFALTTNMRTQLSQSGVKKVRNGFSFPLASAVPYRNHKNEPRVQLHQARLRVEPLARPLGRWLVAEPESDSNVPGPREEYDVLVAEFRAMLAEAPCDVDGATMMRIRRNMELMVISAGEDLPNVNIRYEQAVACAISKHGPYALVDLERLAVLRAGGCGDVSGGLSEEMRALARDLQLQVAPPEGFLSFAKIGLFGVQDPSRMNLTSEEGRARKACVLQYLEDELFSAH